VPRRRIERRIGQRADADRQVGPLLDQVDIGFAAGQFQLDQRIRLQEIGQQGRQQMVEGRRRCIHPHQARRLRTARLRLGLGIGQVAQDGAGALEQPGAFLGQLQAPRRAAHQRHAKALLEPRNGARDPGRCLPQALGGARE
jgi:hypothetical protein